MIVKLKDLLGEGIRTLNDNNVPDAEYDAWAILSFCFDLDKGRYYLIMNETLNQPDNIIEQYNIMIKKRAERIPLQYLIKNQTFMGYDFYVNSSVLIPRQDTEILVGCVLDYAIKNNKKSILDMCTGSGCIAVSLAKLQAAEHIEGVDISEAALEVAERNKRQNNVKVDFYKSNLFENVKNKYDIIVSNPPYIERHEIMKLEPEVREYEPWMALDGGDDGLVFYRSIIKSAHDYLNQEGAIFTEIGYDQADAVAGLYETNGFKQVKIVKDLAGKDRVVWAII